MPTFLKLSTHPKIVFLINRVMHFHWPMIHVIHFPKSAGTYIRRTYDIDRRLLIMSHGHSRLNDISKKNNDKIVGFIREPLSWYSSYFSFHEKSIKELDRSSSNFPENHPVSLLLKYSQEEVIKCFSSLLKISPNHVYNIYEKDIKNIFDFMINNEVGFWSWTLLYHYSDIDIENCGRIDLMSTVKNIKESIDFIKSSDPDTDVNKLFGFIPTPAKKINSSNSKKIPTDLPLDPYIVRDRELYEYLIS